MRKLLGPLLAVALAAAMLLALSTGQALANHVQCGDMITQDTTLDSDLIDCPGDGLIIGADNITLDLNGHTIDGTAADDSAGVRDTGPGVDASGNVLPGYEGVKVEDGAIRGFTYGISGDHASMSLRRLTVADNTDVGVALYGTSKETELLDSDVAHNATYGIQVLYSTKGHRIENNRITDNGNASRQHPGAGLQFDYAISDVVKGNRVSGNATGISTYTAYGIAITGNQVSGNGLGIRLWDTHPGTVTHNEVRANLGDGIEGGHGLYNTLVEDNTVRSNGANGIHLTACSASCKSVADDQFHSNRVSKNAENGILLDDYDPQSTETRTDSSFEGNTVFGNGADGIAVMAVSWAGSHIERNSTMRNGDDGIGVGPIYRTQQFSSLGWSPDGSRLVFASSRDGNMDVYTAKPDGSELKRLTTGGGADPAWSPDGSLIAFTGPDQALYTIHPDGTGLRRIADRQRPYHGLAWSPDGTKLAWGTGDVAVVNADGSGLTRLASGGAPVWSPDGSKIAFLSNGGFPGRVGLYVMDADGSHQIRLTFGVEGGPSWSPDGAKIAFTLGDPFEDVYTINADGTGLTLITDNYLGFDRSPAWSPDGTKIAFASQPCSAESEICDSPGIFTVDPDGSNRSRVTSIPGAPVWSPDGSRIAFQDCTSSCTSAYTVNADGTGLLELDLRVAIDVAVTLGSNRADRNADLGIEATSGVIDGGGNRAKHNGNPAQCVPDYLCSTTGKPK
jgi:parallel beta-helix repeat protein